MARGDTNSGSPTSPHRARALDHLAASLAARDQLADIYARGTHADRQTIADLNERIRLGIKLAQVEALLAVETRITQLVQLEGGR